MTRTLALRPYHILDTLPEQEYDDITLLASQICATPKAVLNFLPHDRQWTKARVGFDELEPTSIPLDESVCIHTMHNPDSLLEIPDLRTDRRTAGHPGVTGDPFMRFYAGAPLITPSGVPVGTLCVVDHVPRALTPGQIGALQALARQVVALLELRRTVAALHESERRFEVFMEHSP
ncbi:MAG TPA: GAF domain-containing protein, partial [Herpetosiphonaceae bacterium]|nr:GAF domain-containing protein [Herpetosiphonaceae bacterium]